MNASGSYLGMPAIKVGSNRDDDDQSRKEKETQLERQLPRMRISEKIRSEKILSTAMKAGETKKKFQEFSTLPRPASIKNKNNTDGLGRYASIPDWLSHHPTDMDDLHHHPAQKEEVNQSKAIESVDLNELHALEELLDQRGSAPSLSDMLAVLKKMEENIKSDQALEKKSKRDAADLDGMLCSLDFLGGYVSASDEMPIIRSEIMGVIEYLRQYVTNCHVDNGTNFVLQQESLVQLLGNSQTQYSTKRDASGNQKLVFEVSESMMDKIVPPPSSSRTKDTAVNQIQKPGDDSLPLVVQRSI